MDFSDVAQLLGQHMAKLCPDGLTGHFGDELLAAFPDETPATLRLALAELEAGALVTLSSLIGPKLPRIHTTVALFVACDPKLTGHDPVEDSVELAERILDDPALPGNARDLEDAVGWPRRRFNPAFALLVPLIEEGRVRTVYQNDYPVMGFLTNDADLLALRRYIMAHG